MKFHTTMMQSGNNTGIPVPLEALEVLGGGKRPAVNVTVNGYSYRGTVAPMGGQFLISFSSDKRSESGIAGGDEIDIELTLDTAPRSVEPPADLAAALQQAHVRAGYDELAPSRQKAHVASVESAKAAETRARRISAVVTSLNQEPQSQ
jgi:hypothetical protein